MVQRFVPTVFVGLGKVGLTAMFRVRGKVQAKAATAELIPPIRFFGLDVDPGVLRAIDGIDPALTETQDLVLQCKFQPPGNYYKKWEDLKNLSGWLDSQFVFQIPTTGGTAGYRPLGRLAVFENLRKIVGRLKVELDQAQQDVAALKRRAAESSLEVEIEPPRILLVTGMGSGFGSGAILDLGYIAQKTLRDAGVADPRVEGILIAGIERDPKNRDQVSVNHFALAQELLQFTQDDAELTVNYGDGKQHFTGPVLTRCTQFDAMVETLPDPKLEAVCDTIGEMVWHGSSTEVGSTLEAATATWPKFRSFGWFELFYPARTLDRRLSLKACEAVLNRWLETLPAKEADDVAAKAEVSLAAAGFDQKNIADLVFQASNGKFGELIFATVGDRMKSLQERFAADPKGDQKEPIKAAVHDIRDLLGTESTESKDDPGSLKMLWALRDGAKEVSQKLLTPLNVNVDRNMDLPGPRLDRVRHALRGYSDYFVKLVDQQTDGAKAELEKCGRLYKSIYDKLDSKLLGAMAGQSGMVTMVGQYANTKVIQRLSENVASVYVTMRGRLSDRLKDMISARQSIDKLRDQVRKELSAPADYGAGYSTQPIFPGGMLSLDEAVDAIYAKLLPEKFDEIERRIQQDAVDPAGGMATVILGDTSLEKGLGARMVAAASSWVREQIGSADVALAFLDRHQADTTNAASELAAFVGWAGPTCPVRPGKPGSADTAGVETIVVTVPESEAGETCLRGIEAAVPNVERHVLRDQFEIVFCRATAHESFARLLPHWVMEFSRPYRTACQGRQSPELFRDLSDR